MELSKTDRAIIEKLREDARQSHRAVAKGLGVSEETARRRIHAMVEAGIIGFGIKISAAAWGLRFTAMLTVQMESPFNSIAVMNTLQLYVEHINTTIDQRLVLVVAAPHLEAIRHEVMRIRLVDGVRDVSVDIFHTEEDWFI